jgi:hypothetical protein
VKATLKSTAEETNVINVIIRNLITKRFQQTVIRQVIENGGVERERESGSEAFGFVVRQSMERQKLHERREREKCEESEERPEVKSEQKSDEEERERERETGEEEDKKALVERCGTGLNIN